MWLFWLFVFDRDRSSYTEADIKVLSKIRCEFFRTRAITKDGISPSLHCESPAQGYKCLKLWFYSIIPWLWDFPLDNEDMDVLADFTWVSKFRVHRIPMFASLSHQFPTLFFHWNLDAWWHIYSHIAVLLDICTWRQGSLEDSSLIDVISMLSSLTVLRLDCDSLSIPPFLQRLWLLL